MGVSSMANGRTASFRRDQPSRPLKRVDSVFRDRITADGSSGFKAAPGRYPSMSRTAVRGRLAP